MMESDAPLDNVLQRSRELGFLGPGDLDNQVAHARMFLPALSEATRVLDLGSGGGLPGLVLATQLTEVEFVLLDAHERRCTFLESAVEQLGISPRVSVVQGRAEELARSETMRASFDAVVSRSFGPPAVTAECAAGFLKGVGSVLAVSEPPEPAPSRWPKDGLLQLGLEPGDFMDGASGGVQVLKMVSSCPDRYPRRVGIPTKRPLF